MTAYYNEHDRNKAAWLRELARRNLIAPGDVDERDIRDVVPAELSGYRQCHFFAGIGIWSYALRNSGWPDDRPVWTGSCPCQPFSSAGQGKGVADERHLWPAWFHLIGQCRPDVVLGEQVASADAKPWLDLVHDDLEAMGYAFGPIVLPASGFGAPHGRHRIWFVADARRDQRRSGRGCSTMEGRPELGRSTEQPPGLCDDLSGLVGDSRQSRLAGRPGERGDDGPELPTAERAGRPTNGFWADAEWLPCRDGKARPVRPGSFPLAHGAPARVVRLRGYGDGIVAPAAEAVIRAYMEVNR